MINRLALITLSPQGARVVERLAAALPGAEAYVHSNAGAAPGTQSFDSIVELTREIFPRYDGLVYIAPCGAVVRALEGNLRHKTSDPAVVVVDVGARYAVSLLSGHEGGGNDLAVRVANALGAEPVITTTTEALKTVIVGIGCRRGVTAEEVTDAVRKALDAAGVGLSEVRLLASADLTADEAGLIEAARALGVPLRFVPGEEIRASSREFARSEFVESKVNLPAVAEPAALLAGRRTRLLLPKTIYGRVTVALARESCSWSASAPEGA